MDCRTDMEKEFFDYMVRMMNGQMAEYIDYQTLAKLDAKSKGLPYYESENEQVYVCEPPFYNRKPVNDPRNDFRSIYCDNLPF